MIVGSPTILNLVPGGVMKCVHVNQVNKNIEIQFKIMNGAAPYNVPEGVTCTIRGTKGDAFGYAAEAAVTAGSNVITVTLTEQLTAVAGAGNIFELVFVGAADDMKVSTENFILAVERQAMGEDTVISDSDLSYAEQVLDQLQSVGAVNAQVQQNKANLAAEISRAQAAEAAETAARQAADNTLQSDINAEASTRATTDASLQSQINQLVAPSGSAPSAAEVENARVGADGTVYQTLGDAIRTQVTDVKSALTDITGNTRVTWLNAHYYETKGNAGTIESIIPKPSNSYKCFMGECSEGDNFFINGTGGVAAKLYAFLDSEYKLISSSAPNATLYNSVITAPENASYITLNVGVNESQKSYLLYDSDKLLSQKVKEIGDSKKNVVPVVKANAVINYQNKETASNEYVCTDYVRVSGDAKNVSLYCTLFFRNTALLFYAFDKSLIGFIDSTNASDYGITSTSNVPTTVNVQMPDNTVFIRANMRNMYYSVPSDFKIRFSNNRTLRETERQNAYEITEEKMLAEQNRLNNLRSKFDRCFNWIAYSNIQGSGMSINTKEHFEWCAKKDVFKSIKADMQLTADGKIILCHDSGFTFDGNGKITTFDPNNCTLIHDMTYDECIVLQHASTNQHVCGIDTVLKVCKKYGKHLYITLRDEYYQSVFDALLEKLRQYSFEAETIVNCYPQNNEKCNYIRSKSSDICISYTCSVNVTQFATAVDTCIGLKNCIITPFAFNSGVVDIINTLAPIQDSINKAKENGLRVYAAIMYQDNATDDLMDCGVTGGQTYILPTDI